jgi:hypothetical protein
MINLIALLLGSAVGFLLFILYFKIEERFKKPYPTIYVISIIIILISILALAIFKVSQAP